MPRVTLTLLPDSEDVDGTGLYELGDHEIYIDLGELGGRLVFLGANDSCHVRTLDPYISGRQAAFLREHGVWTVTPCPEARNPTYLDGAVLQTGQPLKRGSIIRAGCAAWIVTASEHKNGEFCLRAHNLVEFCVAAYRAYGSTRRAAQAIGMSDRTLRRRLADSEHGRGMLFERRPQPRKRHRCSPFGIPLILGAAGRREVKPQQSSTT